MDDTKVETKSTKYETGPNVVSRPKAAVWSGSSLAVAAALQCTKIAEASMQPESLQAMEQIVVAGDYTTPMIILRITILVLWIGLVMVYRTSRPLFSTDTGLAFRDDCESIERSADRRV